MQSKHLARFVAAIFLATFAAVCANAQTAPAPNTPRPHYRLVDLGTLGGPVSYDSNNGEGNQLLNNSGVVGFSADTSVPDPYAPDFCFTPDCFVTHGVQWKNGTLTDLGALPGNNGTNGSSVGAINAHGWSVGYGRNGSLDPLIGGVPVTTAVFWDGQQIQDVGTLGGLWSLASGVSNDGVVTGMATIDDLPDPFAASFGPWPSTTHPFIWRDGQIVDLGTLGGPDAFVAAGCVNQGLVVGSSLTSSTPDPNTGVPPLHPFVWQNGQMVDIGTLGGSLGSAQCGNNRGQVIGQSSLAGDVAFHPFLWDRGVLKDLGTLGGDNASPVWINDAGDVVGEADLPGSETHHAFLWRKGNMVDLGTLDGNSHASAVNSKRQVVGNFSITDRTDPPFRHAFVWEQGGPMIDLNTLIPASSNLELVVADNINERGEIVGVGVPGRCFVDFCGHLFLLIPCAAGDTQGCEDNGDGKSISAESYLAPTPASSTISPGSHATAKERVAAWRENMVQRYRTRIPHAPKQ